ncbi:MAG TPA: polyprenyl synthetase family protein [Phycisphaerae bacterium]|nr:polyprenyl synthetase family protein [Phycisphaerae bacterium]HRR85071.1 polyprenyl synthetase family protein [Phycisphaerae bacterium]
MAVLTTLYEPIAKDLEKVCQIFDDELFSDLPLINDLCAHVRQYRGKLLRPALLLLSGKACGKTTDVHLTLAAVVEMVHMATLVHDDVLDDADLRRRCPTINRLEGNEAAVLLGDYLISHAFHLCSSLGSQHASRVIAATTNIVCEGELQQVHHRGDFNLGLDDYLQIITRKTASLTGACCRLGAHFAGAGTETAANLERYGLAVGIAFQITDDILDIIGSEKRMGKTLGRDLQKSKLTLPVIHCLTRADDTLRKELHLLLAGSNPDRNRLRNLLETTDSINYSLHAARDYIESAIARLDDLPPSQARHSLSRLARLIISREQ